MVVSINLFDTNSRVDDLYEELAVRNARTSKVADDLIKVDDLIFNLTQSGSMSRDQKTELEGYINDLLTSANALQATRYPKEVGAIKTSAKAIADTIRYEIYKALENNDQRLSADLYTKRIVPDFDIISKATQYFSKVHIQGARDEILEMRKTAPIYIISTIQFALS